MPLTVTLKRNSNSGRRRSSRGTKSDLSRSLLGDNGENSKSSEHFYEISPLRSNVYSKEQINSRNNTINQANKEHGYDLVVVVPNPRAGTSSSTDKTSSVRQGYNGITSMEDYYLKFEEIIERLLLANLDLYMFYSSDEEQKYIFIKIKASVDVLKQHAEQIGYPLRVDEIYARDHIDIPHASIANDPNITKLTPYEYIYIPYNGEKQGMFANASGYNHPFSPTVRIKLILSIMQTFGTGCCSMNLEKLIASKSIVSYFPLHDAESRDILAKHWFPLHINPRYQPFDEIKEYFGEKVGIYYAFFGHYTSWLGPLSIAGLIVCLDIIIESAIYKNFGEALVSGYLIPFYCIFVSFWAQFMLEYWKRKEVTMAMEWGQTEFEETESDRAQFNGDFIQSVINGKRIKYFSPREKFKRLVYSYGIIMLMILLVIGCVSLIFFFQYLLNERVSDDNVKTDGSSLASVGSAIQIVVLKLIYDGVAKHLTNLENHRTDTEYEDSLIVKLFAFNFVNSYASLLFIAFIKSNVEPCNGSCFVELSFQLTFIFGFALVLDKGQKIAYFYGKRYYNDREVEKAKESAQNGTYYPLSQAEKDFMLDDFDSSLDTLGNYAEVATQFGFVTLFVAACPLAPLLAYLSNFLEIRLDGYNMIYNSKRVLPCGGEDIGSWMAIFQIISYACVVSNAGLLCFTMQLITFNGVGKIWIFIVFQYVILLFMAFFAYIVDDIPQEVKIQLERQSYLNELVEMSEEEREAILKGHKENFTQPVQQQNSNIQIHQRDESV